MPELRTGNAGPTVEAAATTAYYHTQASHAKLREKVEPRSLDEETPRQLTDWANFSAERSRLRCRDSIVDAGSPDAGGPAGLAGDSRPVRLKISKVAQVLMRGHGNLLTGCEPPSSSAREPTAAELVSPRTQSALRERRAHEAKAAAAFLAAAKRRTALDTVVPPAPYSEGAAPAVVASARADETAAGTGSAGGDATTPGAGRPAVTETPSRLRMCANDAVRSPHRRAATGPAPDTTGREFDWWATPRTRTPRAEREAAILRQREAKRASAAAERFDGVAHVPNARSQCVVTGRVVGTGTDATAVVPRDADRPRPARRITPQRNNDSAQMGAVLENKPISRRGRSPGAERNRSSLGAAAALHWDAAEARTPLPEKPPASRARSTGDATPRSRHAPVPVTTTAAAAATTSRMDRGVGTADDAASVRSHGGRSSRRSAAPASERSVAGSVATSRRTGASRASTPAAAGVSAGRGGAEYFKEWVGSIDRHRSPSPRDAAVRHGRRDFPQQRASTKGLLQWW